MAIVSHLQNAMSKTQHGSLLTMSPILSQAMVRLLLMLKMIALKSKIFGLTRTQKQQLCSAAHHALTEAETSTLSIRDMALLLWQVPMVQQTISMMSQERSYTIVKSMQNSRIMKTVWKAMKTCLNVTTAWTGLA